MVFFLLIIGFAVAVYFDAKKRGVKHQGTGELLDLGPVGWALATGLLWIISFPLYLISRQKTPDESGIPARGKNNAIGWIGYCVFLTIIVFSQFSESSKALEIKAQLQPIAEQLDTAQKTGDKPTVLSLYEPVTKKLNDFAALSDPVKAEINSKPLRYCYIAIVNLSTGLSEVMQTGQWLTRAQYVAALDMCK